MLIINLSKKQTIANLYYSIKHHYNFKGLRLLVFTIEHEMFLRTIEVEEFLAEFEQRNPTYLQAYEHAYAKILINLANLPDDELTESLLEGDEDQSHTKEDVLLLKKRFKKYKEILENIEKNLSEEFTTKTLKEMGKIPEEKFAEQTLKLKEGTSKKCLSEKDLLEALNFESEFIPITEQGQYRGIVEKRFIIQLLVENLFKEYNGMENSNVKN